jgi:hypothetical protein
VCLLSLFLGFVICVLLLLCLRSSYFFVVVRCHCRHLWCPTRSGDIVVRLNNQPELFDYTYKIVFQHTNWL